MPELDELDGRVGALKARADHSDSVWTIVFECCKLIGDIACVVTELKDAVKGSGAHNIGHTRRIEVLEKECDTRFTIIDTQKHEERLQALEKFATGFAALTRVTTWAGSGSILGYLLHSLLEKIP